MERYYNGRPTERRYMQHMWELWKIRRLRPTCILTKRHLVARCSNSKKRPETRVESIGLLRQSSAHPNLLIIIGKRDLALVSPGFPGCTVASRLHCHISEVSSLYTVSLICIILPSISKICLLPNTLLPSTYLSIQ